MKVEIRRHGRTIRGEITYPKRRKKLMPAVLLVHGSAADRNYYWFPKLQKRLARSGYVVLNIDLSGHGKSDGRFENTTYSKAIEDVVAAAKFLKAQPHVNSHATGVLGHSRGGTAALLAQSHGAGFKTLVLVAPVGDTKWHVRWRYSRHAVRAWKRAGHRTWYDRRLDKNLSEKYSFYEDMRRHDSLKAAAVIHQPVIIIHGTNDRAVPLVESRRLLNVLDQPKRLAVVHGARHSFRTPAMQRRLFAVIVPWLREYLSKRTSRSVAAFVMNRGRILILKRSRQVGYHRGKWGIIAGHLPDGTVPLSQAYAEVREEAGFRRSDLRLIRVGSTVRVSDTSVGKAWVSTPFVFEAKTRRVRLNWEHAACRWVKPDRFPFARCYPGIEKQFKAVGLL